MRRDALSWQRPAFKHRSTWHPPSCHHFPCFRLPLVPACAGGKLNLVSIRLLSTAWRAQDAAAAAKAPHCPHPVLARLASTCSQLRVPWRAQVVDHYDNPRNVGSFNKNDEDVGTGLVGAPACGDVMKLQLRVRLVLSCPLRSAGTGCRHQPCLWHQLRTILYCCAG